MRGQVEDLVHLGPGLHVQVFVPGQPPGKESHRMQGFHRASWRGKFSPGGGPRHREGPRARIVKPRTTGIKPAPWMIEGGENGAIGGTGHGGLLPSTDDVVYVTGGLQPCSGPTGLGGVPRSADAEIANPFVLTFLDSGAVLKCVHRFSGRAFWQGTVGVAVKGIEYDPRLRDGVYVPAAFTPGPASQEGWCQWE